MDVLVGAEERQDSVFQRDECRSRRAGRSESVKSRLSQH